MPAPRRNVCVAASGHYVASTCGVGFLATTPCQECKMKTITLIAAALVAGTAFAGDETMASKSFESLDKNADGRITASESVVDKKLAADFATVDANSDGAVSKEEFTKWQAAAKPQAEPVEQPKQ